MKRVTSLFLATGTIAAVAGMFLMGGESRGETCKLELKRIASRRGGMSLAEYQFQATYPQHFQLHFQTPQAGRKVQVVISGQEGQEAAFKRVVKKQPEKYNGEHPFRGVAKLGTQEFAFVLDTAAPPPEKTAAKPAVEAESDTAKPGLLETLARALTGDAQTPELPRGAGRAVAYGRLYFDLNHNGDLTDDQVIEAEKSERMPAAQHYASSEFPPVTVAVEADGVKFDYVFRMSVTSYVQSVGFVVAYASLNAAAYREGEITLDGKKRRVALIDFNSNWRFDDQIKIRDEDASRDGEVNAAYGDVLLLDPETKANFYINPYDVTASRSRHQVSKLLNVEGKYYELKISPAGDQLSLIPTALPLGSVTNPNEGFTAVVYGDQGFVKIRGGKSQPALLPAGQWKLLSYTLDQTAVPKPQPKPGEKAEAAKDQTAEPSSGGLLGALVQALAGSGDGVAEGPFRLTCVSAQATQDYQPVVVRPGAAVELPFGPPYKPVVRVEYAQGAGQVQIGLQLVGITRERCTDMTVQGNRPPAPQFKITDPKGEVVYQGTFKYG